MLHPCIWKLGLGVPHVRSRPYFWTRPLLQVDTSPIVLGVEGALVFGTRLASLRRDPTWVCSVFPQDNHKIKGNRWYAHGFSRMRSKGSRFTLGVWRLRVCSLDAAFTSATVRNPSQPFATVRNRPQPFATVRGRAYSKFSRRRHFWTFQTSHCFVSRGRRCASWHSDAFCNVSKVVLCGRRNTFAMFWDVLKIDGSLARNIDFEVANLEVPKKTRRKTSVLMLQSVKIGGRLVLLLPRDPTCLVSSLWLSCGVAPTMGEAAKPLLVESLQLWKLAEVSH